MTDLSIATDYLGAEFEFHPSGIWIHQIGYIRKLLEKFRMTNCITANIPMDPGIKLRKDMGTNTFDPHLYQSLVDDLIYATNSRPDICSAISCVSHYMDNPEDAHWKAAKHIL